MDTQMLFKAFNPEIKSIDETTRTIAHLISTESPDEDGDVIETKGWDFSKFEKNPIVLFAHRRDEPPIGRAIRIEATARGIEASTQFPPKGVNPDADIVYEMNRLGYLKTWSVGFIPHEWEPMSSGKGQRFRRQTLYEYSSVPLPANPEAMNLAISKGLVNARMLDMLGWAKGAAIAPAPAVDIGVEFQKGLLSMEFEAARQRLRSARHVNGKGNRTS